MCILPDTATKVLVLVAIPVTAAVHITEIVLDIMSLESPETPKYLIYLCVSVCLLLLGGLGVGLYGTLFSKLAFLQVMMFIIVVHVLVKIYIWIIVYDKPNYDDHSVNTIWFQAGLACSVICFITAIIYYLRLRMNLYQID